MKKLDKQTLINVGKTLYERLKDEEKDIRKLPLRRYHRFDKYTVNPNWYSDLADPEDLMVEIAIVHGQHKERHYHKHSHAFNAILGAEHGVCDCPEGSEIVVEDTVLNTGYYKMVYFLENQLHTFNAPEGKHFYFLSMQSPPLEKPDGSDDFFWEGTK